MLPPRGISTKSGCTASCTASCRYWLPPADFGWAKSRSQHRPRRFGRSKYGIRRFVTGFLDLLTVKFLTGFGQRPQHLLGAVGLACFLLGGLGLVLFDRLLGAHADCGPTWVGPPCTNGQRCSIRWERCCLGGQLMSIGFLAELIIAYQARDSDTYSIAERTQPPGRVDENLPGDHRAIPADKNNSIVP